MRVSRERARANGRMFVLRLGVTLLLAANSWTANASDLRVRASSMAEAYMVAGPEGVLLARRRLVQYLQLDLSDILGPTDPRSRFRAPEDGQLRVVSQFRIQHGFGEWREDARGRAETLLDLREDRQLDLLFGYLEGRQLGDVLDFRIGRQLDPAQVDWFAMDGASITLSPPGRFRDWASADIWGGWQLRARSPLGAARIAFEGTDTSLDEDAPPERGFLLGAALSTSPIPQLRLRGGYRRAFASLRQGDPTTDVASQLTEVPAFSGGVEQELLFGQLRITALSGKLELNSAVNYELATGRIQLARAELVATLGPRHALTAEWLRSVPVFDLDSIFSVFQAGAFTEGRLKHRWRLAPAFHVIGVGHLRYRDDPENAKNSILGGGGTLTFGYFRSELQASLMSRMHVEADWTQWTQLLRFDWSPSRSRWSTGLQFHQAVAQNDRAPRPQAEGALAWTGSVQLYEGIHLRAIAEELISTQLRHSLRVFGALTFDANLRVGAR